MEYITIIIISIVFLVILWFVCEIDIRKVKQIGENKELNELTKTFPENINICKSILKKLNNEDVKIKEERGSKTSLYVVVTNTITIADIKDSYTRIQTIAHECLHSIQNKRMLWFNFIYTNIYVLYFFIVSILTVFKIIKEPIIFITILAIFSLIHYFVRSYLETDAMTKARYVAKEYLEENKICDEETINTIVGQYDKLNDIGIKMVNYKLLFDNVVKITIYTIICMFI